MSNRDSKHRNTHRKNSKSSENVEETPSSSVLAPNDTRFQNQVDTQNGEETRPISHNVEHQLTPLQPHHRPQQRTLAPLETSYVFPTLGDLPNLLLSSVGTVFLEAQLEHIQNLQLQETSTDVVKDEVVIEEVQDLDGESEVPTISARSSSLGDIDETSVYKLFLANSDKNNVLRSGSVQKSVASSEQTLSENPQTLTTSLDDMLNLHQRRAMARHAGVSDDDFVDETVGTVEYEAARAAYFRGIVVTLFLIMLIVAGNVGGALLMLRNTKLVRRETPGHPYACNTESCQRMSKWIRRTMDPKVEPCNDFYMFACGTYVNKQPAHDTGNSDPFFLYIDGIPMNFQENSHVGNFLKKVDKFPENQLLPFYQACIDTRRRNQHGILPLVHLLAQVRVLAPQAGSYSLDHRFNIARTMGRIFRRTNRMFFVDLDDIVDNMILFKLAKPASEVINTPVVDYVSTMRKAWRLLGDSLYIDGDDEIDTIIYVVMKFEAEIGIIQSKGTESTIFGFPTHFDEVVPKPAKFHPNFDRVRGRFNWDDLVATIMGYPQGSYANYHVTFNLWSSFYSREDRFYLIQLEYTLKNTQAYVLFRYFQWELMKMFAFDLNGEIQDIMLIIARTSGRNIIERCFRSVFSNLHVLAAHRYKMLVNDTESIEQNMGAVSERIVRTYVDTIKHLDLPAAFKVSMLATSKTLKVMMEDVSSLTPHLAEYYSHLNCSKDHFKNVIEARSIKAENAVKKVNRNPPYHKWTDGTYSLTEITETSLADSLNTIRYLHVPFGAMQEPFLGNDLPILNYAGYGHYMVSFYLLRQALIDLFQVYEVNTGIWEPRDEVVLMKKFQKEFLEKVECILEAQGDNRLSRYPDLKFDPYMPATRMRLLANAFSLELTMLVIDKIFEDTYKANRSLKEIESPMYELRHGNEKIGEKFPKYQVLIGLEKYNPRQLVFLSLARQNCNGLSRARAEYRMKYGPLLREIGVKNAFRNSETFSKVWGCKKTDFMNPKRKCKLFTGHKLPSPLQGKNTSDSLYDENTNEHSYHDED